MPTTTGNEVQRANVFLIGKDKPSRFLNIHDIHTDIKYLMKVKQKNFQCLEVGSCERK